eukprot:4468968-Prymnesium_polylepis.1
MGSSEQEEPVPPSVSIPASVSCMIFVAFVPLVTFSTINRRKCSGTPCAPKGISTPPAILLRVDR